MFNAWQISAESAGLAFPVKILMRSGVIARTGFGAAICFLAREPVERATRGHGTVYGLQMRSEKLAPLESTPTRESLPRDFQIARTPPSRCRSSAPEAHPASAVFAEWTRASETARILQFRNRYGPASDRFRRLCPRCSSTPATGN